MMGLGNSYIVERCLEGPGGSLKRTNTRWWNHTWGLTCVGPPLIPSYFAPLSKSKWAQAHWAFPTILLLNEYIHHTLFIFF